MSPQLVRSILACLLLAACASLAPLEIEGDTRAARVQLAAAAAAGPVPIVLRAVPSGISPEQVVAAARRGPVGLQPVFEPAATIRPGTLVLAFAAADPAGLCRPAPGQPAPAQGGTDSLLAVWCGLDGPVAAVRLRLAATTPEAVERGVWRAVRRLFPDDYADRYGFDLFGLRIGIGATFGF